ncbi:MAG: PilW family protein [Candidatus Acidiferrales bacterium]
MTTPAQRRPRQAGFSLVEIMVVLVIFIIVTSAVFGLLNTAQIRYSAEKRFLESFQGARIGVDLIVRDIHNAGYPPPYTYPGNFPKLPTGPTPALIPDPVPWEVPTLAGAALQERFAIGIVGVRNGVVDLGCTVNGGALPCTFPTAFDLILELDVDPETADPALGPDIEWVRYQLCWIQPDGTCLRTPKPAGATTSVVVRAVDVKDAVSDPSVVVLSNVPFVENIVQDPSIAVGALLPDGTRNTAVFTYVCTGGALSCPVEDVESVIINLRVRSADPDLQTRQRREITLRALARRLNPSR